MTILVAGEERLEQQLNRILCQDELEPAESSDSAGVYRTKNPDDKEVLNDFTRLLPEIVVIDEKYINHLNRLLQGIKDWDEDVQLLVLTSAATQSSSGLMARGADFLLYKPLREEDLAFTLQAAVKAGEKIKALRNQSSFYENQAEYYRKMLDCTADWEGLLDTEGNFTYSSAASRRITGYAAGELMEDSHLFWKIVHPEEYPRLKEFINNSLASGVSSRMEFRIFHREGEIRWIGLLSHPFYGAGKELLGLRISCRDISERKQAEQELKQYQASIEVLNNLLSLAQKDIPLENLLEQAVELVVSLPWLAFRSTGSIFLLEEENLVLKAQKGLESSVLSQCTSLPLGKCLCGKAALTGEVQFAEDMDERHEIRGEDMTPHGHYCVPVKLRDKVLGVLNVYLYRGHQRNEEEERFLVAVADTLAAVVERKRYEEALWENEKKFREIFENSNDAIFLQDLKGNIVEANRAACQKLGYSRDKLLKMSLTDFVSHDYVNTLFDRLDNLLENGHLVFESADVSREGRVIPVEVNAAVVEMEGEYHVLSIARDISARKEAEETLKYINQELERRVQERTEELARANWELEFERSQMFSIFDSINEVIYVADPYTYEILYVNQFMRDSFAREVVGDLCYRVIQGKESPCDFCTNSIILQNEGEPYQWEHFNPLIQRHFLITDRIIKWPDGRKVRFALAIDITERKHMEEDLKRSLERMSAFFDQVNIGLNIFDENMRYLEINELAASYLGKAMEEVKNRTVQEVAPDFAGNIEESLKKVLETGEPERNVEISGRLSGSSETVHWLSAHVPLTLPDGSPGVGVAALDITERKQAEDALRRRITELEALYTVSTALRAAESLEEMLFSLLKETLSVMDTESGGIWLYYSHGEELRLASASGWFSLVGESSLEPGEGIVGKVFSSGRVYVSRDISTDESASSPVKEQAPGGYKAVFNPVRKGSEVAGVMAVSLPPWREFTPEELKLINSLSELAGSAVHRLSLYEETLRRLQQIQALRAVDQAINSSLDLRLALNVLLEHVTLRLEVDAAAVFLMDPHLKELKYASGRGFQTRKVEQLRLRLGESCAGKAALERRTFTVIGLEEAPDQKCADLLKAEGMFTCICMPLVSKGEVKGVLEVFLKEARRPDEEWLDFLETLAGQASLAIDNASLFEEVQKAHQELSLAYDVTIEGWSRALELRDRETEGHTRRVTEMTLELSRIMQIHESWLPHIRRGALLHDIGKMGISDAILLKPGKLNDEEWAIMQQHPYLALEMLSPIEYLRPALNIPYCHHEKWDGTGYPRGLKGEEIPLEARIFAVVDVFDALTSDRPYRAAWSRAEALRYIREQSGSHFDPRVVELFLQEIDNIEEA